MSEELDHLRARRDRLQDEIESMRRDVKHWNREHPDEVPIDVDNLLAKPLAIFAEVDRKVGLK